MNAKWLGLEGKTVLVTGGAMGIGRAVCEGFAECGAHVVVADISEDAGVKAVEEITAAFGGEHLFVRADVTDKSAADNAVQQAVEAFGSLDVLVNNAGINIPRLLVDPAGKEEVGERDLDLMLAINFKGMFLFAQASARAMVRQGNGVIVNMASESGMEGSEGQSVYAATKASAYNMTRSWSKELGKHGIRVAGMAPGIMEATALRTEEYERALAYTRGITVDELRAKYKTVSIPLGRSGKLSEAASVACFLASDRAGYVHGTVINVSGGKTWA